MDGETPIDMHGICCSSRLDMRGSASFPDRLPEVVPCNDKADSTGMAAVAKCVSLCHANNHKQITEKQDVAAFAQLYTLGKTNKQLRPTVTAPERSSWWSALNNLTGCVILGLQQTMRRLKDAKPPQSLTAHLLHWQCKTGCKSQTSPPSWDRTPEALAALSQLPEQSLIDTDLEEPWD